MSSKRLVPDQETELPKKKRQRKTKKEPVIIQRSKEHPFLLGDIVYCLPSNQGYPRLHCFGKITKITPTGRYRIIHLGKTRLNIYPLSSVNTVVIKPNLNQTASGGGTLAKLIEGLLCFKNECWALYNSEHTYVDEFCEPKK